MAVADGGPVRLPRGLPDSAGRCRAAAGCAAVRAARGGDPRAGATTPRTRPIPVVFITAVERALTAERLAGCQYAGLIHKPFTPDELLATVPRHLARSLQARSSLPVVNRSQALARSRPAGRTIGPSRGRRGYLATRPTVWSHRRVALCRGYSGRGLAPARVQSRRDAQRSGAPLPGWGGCYRGSRGRTRQAATSDNGVAQPCYRSTCTRHGPAGTTVASSGAAAGRSPRSAHWRCHRWPHPQGQLVDQEAMRDGWHGRLLVARE